MECYIYCTKGSPKLYKNNETAKYYLSDDEPVNPDDIFLNGKIVAVFSLNEVLPISSNKIAETYYIAPGIKRAYKDCLPKEVKDILKESCLEFDELRTYLGSKDGYGWKIENLRELNPHKDLQGRAPQSWQYIEISKFKHVLISIKSQWVCKILNGKKTVEVRKSYPKLDKE